MNFELNYEGYEKHLVVLREDEALKGVQYLFRFDNEYGASVIKHGYSYGGEKDLWELAVIKYTDSLYDKYLLVYDTPITDNVLGYLTDEQVRDTLKQIKEL